MRTTSRWTATALTAALVLTACGDGRSPAAFCDTMAEHRERYTAAMHSAQGQVGQGDAAGLLGGTVQAFTALADLQVMWNELAEVAPEEIRVDVERIRDTSQKQLDALGEGSLLSSITSGVVSGLSSTGSYGRVDEFTRIHCD